MRPPAVRFDRIDPVLVAGGALVAGGVAVVAPGEVVAATCAIVGLAWRARVVGRKLVVLIAAVLLFGAWRARRLVALHESSRRAADATLGPTAFCAAHARVISSPVRQRGAIRWDGMLDAVSCAGAPVAWRGRATLYGGPEDLARGDEAEVVATLAPPQRLWNAATGDPRPGEARRGVLRSGGAADVRVIRRATGPPAAIDRLRARIRARIDATFAPDLAPMVRALVLGENDLAPDDDRAFRASGLSHLLAVSGMHLVLVLAFGVRASEAVLSRLEGLAARFDVGRFAAAAGVALAWAYADLAGGGGSTVRAAWMTTAALVARAMGRKGEPTRAFGLSLLAMGAADPLVGFDLSFVLSAAATAGLLAFAEPLGERLARVRLWRPLVEGLATTLAASVPCAPILARFAPSVPLGGAVANLVAVPLGECAALPLCLVHALLAWWPAAERGCAAAASGALVLVRAVARAFSAPALGAQIPEPTSWQLAASAVLLAVVVLPIARKGPLAVACTGALVAFEIAARRDGAPRGVLRATFLDVGQGDAAIVDLPDGEAMVIDGGGLVGSPIDVGSRVLAPGLRLRRRRALAVIVLTHPHPDHFGGLATGLDDVSMGALWDTGQGEREQVGGGYAALIARARALHVPLLRPPQLCGSRVVGGARVDVLAPCPDVTSDRGPNDNSFVLRITYGRRSLLFAGDAEHEEEATVLASSGDRLHADVLKVGHHGSRTSSTPPFLAAVGPAAAIVSVGVRNRFGHPSEATLTALGRVGARVWRTDRDGAVVVTSDGASLEVRCQGAVP